VLFCFWNKFFKNPAYAKSYGEAREGENMPLIEMEFKELNFGFFLYDGKLYFAFLHGNWVFHFPVIDGKIQRHDDGSNILPWSTVEVIPISEVSEYGMPIKENENPMDSKFWSQ
jgi:hypothetical protein